MEPEVGAIYDGTVVKITDFGAFVQIVARHRRTGAYLASWPTIGLAR